MSFRKLAIVIGIMGAAGCSSSGSAGNITGAGDDLASFCQKTAQCGTKDIAGESFTQDECEVILAGWIPPPGCASAVQQAACSDFNQYWPNLSASIKGICAPSCLTEKPAVCNTDQTQITKCDPSDGLRTFDCASYCSAIKKSYSGTCGTSYGGQTSTVDKCWCN